MSYLKSALFYLQEVAKFVKKKGDIHGSIEAYCKQLGENEQMTKEFLEKVVGNYYRYIKSKEKFDEDKKEQLRFQKSVRDAGIAMQVIVPSLVFLLALLRVIKTVGAIEKVKTGIIAVGVSFTTVMSMLLLNHFSKSRLQDISASSSVVEAETTYFMQMNDAYAIVLFLGVSHTFTTLSNKQKKVYDGKYRDYNLTVVDLIFTSPGRGEFKTFRYLQKDWKRCIFEVLKPCLERIYTEYEEVIRLISLSTTPSMLKEIKVSVASLKELVNATEDGVRSFTLDEVKGIINNEIVPLFALPSQEISLIENTIKFQATDPIKTIATKTDKDCAYECGITDKCMVAAFNVPSQKCSLYNTKLNDQSIVTKQGLDKVSYKQMDGTTLFVKGGDLVQVSGTKTWDIKGESQSQVTCIAECANNDECITASFNDSKCNLTLGSEMVKLDQIGGGCDDAKGNCKFYKQSMNGLKTSKKPNDLLVATKEWVKNKIVAVLVKYKIDVVPHFDHIKNSISAAVSADYTNEVWETCRQIVDEAQQTANAKASQVVNKRYITQEQFQSKFEELHFTDLQFLSKNAKTLHHALSSLSKKVNDNLAKDVISDEGNIPILKASRRLTRYRHLVITGSVLICLALGYFLLGTVTGWIKSGEKTIHGFVDIFIKAGVPILLTVFCIIFMVAVYKKAVAKYNYNREVLEKNAGSLLSSIDSYDDTLQGIANRLMKSNQAGPTDTRTLKELSITPEEVEDVYLQTIELLESYERCNLLMECAQGGLPFPWVDITIYAMVIGISIMVILVMFFSINPMEKLNNIRELNRMGFKLASNQFVSMKGFEAFEGEDIGSVIKIVSFIVFAIIVILFCIKLMNASATQQIGMFNSKYYEESRCTTS